MFNGGERMDRIDGEIFHSVRPGLFELVLGGRASLLGSSICDGGQI